MIEFKTYSELETGEIYKLLEDIYTSSDTMSEIFEEKFPNLNSCSVFFEDILNLPGGIALFAILDEKLAGFLVIKPRHQAKIKHTSELNMGVSSCCRGKKVGLNMLQRALEMAEEENILEIIYLMVREDNLAGIKLYKKAGFEQLAVLEKDTKINRKYYSGILMRRFVSKSF